MLNISISIWISEFENGNYPKFLNHAFQYFEPPEYLNQKLFPLLHSNTNFLNYPIVQSNFHFPQRLTKFVDSSVFQSYSYRSTSPRVSIGCASIVVAFFLLVTGGILVTVYKHKNEQKGKLYNYVIIFYLWWKLWEWKDKFLTTLPRRHLTWWARFEISRIGSNRIMYRSAFNLNHMQCSQLNP